ncbi:uncharacterized protein LOC121872891 [Homarus americanus]|uniref:uncharacterized protein LOC121872891 n=1 Tax=Homarus americanus TaxID=6706 RepID=UPI001C46E0B9|nr:uncharacterized protein LOC121872891 [Homarus americanus]XP_042231916.1 uncharacterized protein LOC121872891 [Homarus americanus]
MFVLMEPRNTGPQFMGKEENSEKCDDRCDLERNDMYCSASDDAPCDVEQKVNEFDRKDDNHRIDNNGIIGYKVIEKHASDPCLTLRIAVQKGNSSVISEDKKPSVELTQEDNKQDLSKCSITPGFWKPAKRKKKNLHAGNRKKSWRLECMVPGCSTRAYSSRFVDFPDDVEKRIEWARLTKVNEKFPEVSPSEALPARIGLCMGHFMEENFNVFTRGDGKLCKLKEGVDPSIFPWIKSSNVTTGLDIFENLKYSREMRLLSLMKSELYHMINPPTRGYEEIMQDPYKTNEIYEDQKDPLKTDTREESETKLPRICEQTDPSHLGQNEEELYCLPRRCRTRVPINYSDQNILVEGIEALQDPSEIIKDKNMIFNHPRRCRTNARYISEPDIIHLSREIPHYPVEIKETDEDIQNFPRNNGRLPRACKQKSVFGTSVKVKQKIGDRNARERSRAKCRKENFRNRYKKKLTVLNSSEDCLYDVKIENCEVELPEVDCSVEESNASVSTNQEQQIYGDFNHFLEPLSNPTVSNEQPCQDPHASLNAQMIASCVEAVMNPMMARLEIFQGNVETRIEQLEGKVNSRLENLEGRINLCLEKLECLSNNHHSKPSIPSGMWTTRCDNMPENSTPVALSNGITTPVHHMEVNLKPFAISEREYEMMEGEDILEVKDTY